MQQPLSRRVVHSPSVVATVNGAAVEVSSATVDRSLPDPLAGGSLTAASASFTAVEGPAVVEKIATPWDPSTTWPPTPESAVSVSMNTGSGPVSLLQGGRVTAVSGGTSGREVEVESADRYQTLDRTISWDNLADAMPLAAEAQGDRYVGLQSVAITDRILRHCGWYATPPRLNYTLLSVPAMGTMWAEAGRCDTSVRGTTGGYPGWDATSWGVGVHDVDATYTLAGAGYTLAERGNFEMAAMTTSTPGTNSVSVTAAGGAGMFRLLWSDSTGYIQVRNAAGAYVSVANVARSEGLLYATVRYVSATSVSATVRSGGVSSTGTLTVTSAVTGTKPDAASINIALNSHASGFIVAMPATGGALTSWKPSVNMRMRQFNRNYFRVLKAVESENCVDLLAAQCEAECATYWIDELGVLQWWDLGRLEAQANVATLTSDDDIAEAGFTWAHDYSQVKSGVLVKWQEPTSTRRWRTSVDLWQGSGQSLQPNEADVEEWVNVPDDEVWLSPDISPLRVGTHPVADFNNGVGTWYGGVIAGAGDDEDRWAHLNGSLLMSIERITDSAFKLTTEWHGNKPAVQRTISEKPSSDLWMSRRNFDLPIIRGRARYRFLERSTYSAQSGPSTAPEHQIDAGMWIQVAEQAEYTANFAGARLTVPQPVLSSVALIPFPGLQLGDVVTVTDTARTRLTIRGIVIEDSRDIDADMSMSHAVTIRPTHVTVDGITWAEWATFMDGTSWNDWADNQGGTWQGWASDPLG